MNDTFELITVNADNLDTQGFFCYMSKRKAPGYSQKRDWLAARLAEGLKLHMVHETGGRTVGFIEYIPGEFAWRAVHAPGYLVIHCLWVVGKGKGKGYGARLIQICLDDARAQGKHGVVMVASDGVWLAKKDIFLKHGFVEIAQAPPSFQLLAYRFDDAAPLPTFPTDWEGAPGPLRRGADGHTHATMPLHRGCHEHCPGICSGERHSRAGGDLPVSAGTTGKLPQSLRRLRHRAGWPAPRLSLPPAQGFR